MNALVYTKYGPPEVLQLTEVEKPVPGDDEVLIKVCATSVNAADWRLLKADPFVTRFYSGLLRPKFRILGADIAGRVEAVGKGVERLRPGDAVFGDLSGCGRGGFAEFVCAHEDALALKPINLSFEEAAAVPLAAVTALQGLRDRGRIQSGQKVLVHGASGGVGTFAVQLAKVYGADVTAVCSTRNLDQVRSLGADHVIDYTQEDFSKSGRRYDLILAVNGYHPISTYQRSLSPDGTYVMVGGSTAQLFQTLIFGPWMSMAGSRRMTHLTAKPCQEDLIYLKGLIEAGAVRPVLDRRYKFEEFPEALRYLEEGHARGKVVIVLEHDGKT
jgi:NADPH:quinone reductase-like Zn-dependent oxidoreductase